MINQNTILKDYKNNGFTFKIANHLSSEKLDKAISLFWTDTENRTSPVSFCIFLGKDNENNLIYFQNSYNLSRPHLVSGIYEDLIFCNIIYIKKKDNFRFLPHIVKIGSDYYKYGDPCIYIYENNLECFHILKNSFHLNKKLLKFKNFNKIEQEISIKFIYNKS